MKYCMNCGQQLEDNQAFCSACGTAQPSPPPQNEAQGQPVQQVYGNQQPQHQLNGSQFNAPPKTGLLVIAGKAFTLSDLFIAGGYIIAIISCFLPAYYQLFQDYYSGNQERTASLIEIFPWVFVFLVLGISVFWINKYKKSLKWFPLIVNVVQLYFYQIVFETLNEIGEKMRNEYANGFTNAYDERYLTGYILFFFAATLIFIGVIIEIVNMVKARKR